MPTRRQFLTSTAVSAAALWLTQNKTAADPASAATGSEAGSAAAPEIAPAVAPVGTIDWHNHWISDNTAALLQATNVFPPRQGGGGGAGAGYGGGGGAGAGGPRPSGGLSTMTLPIDQRIDHLDSVGVSRQVISWATTTGWDAVLSADQAKPIWTTFNDDLAGVIRLHPDRFSGYAAVTTADIDWSAKELERAYTQLGLIGVVLPVGAFQSLKGAQYLTPIFEVTQAHRGIVYLHSGPAYPTVPGQIVLSTPYDDAPRVRYDLEWAATYARGFTTLAETTFLDEYPDVTIQVAMLGGLAPFVARALTTQPGNDSADRPERWRRIYLDASTTRAPHTLELAVQAVGPDRVLFGSDFGAWPSVAPTISAVQASRLTSAEQQQIFVENGRALYAQHSKTAA